MAKTLGAGFIKHGYKVKLGTRSPEKLNEWQIEQGADASIGSFSDASNYSDILVLAVKGAVAKDVLKLIGEDVLNGKTIMDATNPIDSKPPENGVLQFFTNQNGSLMEDLQESIPGANFVKAFNSVGSAQMVNPSYEVKPSMFICGNNENAKSQIAEITELFGWETIDMGQAEAARAIEPLCMLWCIPGFLNNQWTHAFKLLK